MSDDNAEYISSYQMSVDDSDATNDPLKQPDPTAIEKLSNTFLYLHVNDLKTVAEPLDELRRNQESLIEALINENGRFEEAKSASNLNEMFQKVNYYHNKLVCIKKDMVLLHEKAAKLKKRALRLQQLKEKEMQSGR